MRRPLVGTIAVFLFWLAPSLRAAPAALEVNAGVLRAEASRIEVVRKATAATLAVFAGEVGGGSGVIITPDGYALTNFHVAQPAGNAMKCGLPDGKLYDAVIVGLDPTGDVALIKLFGRTDFPAPELGDSDQVRPGDMAFTSGNPFLLATDYQPSVAYGVISGVRRYQGPAGTLLEYADCLQTDAAINPGNSGGPLFDAAGRLIGINGRGSFEKRGRVNVGVGYAVSINQIKNFMGQLRSGRIVDHAELGAMAGTDDQGRVVVTAIDEHSDAFRQGLRYDDEIVRFAGRSIRSVNAFKNVLGTLPMGWRVPLVYRRQGQTYETLVRLSGVHGQGELEALLAQAPAEPEGPPKDPRSPDKKPGKGPKLPQLPHAHPAAPMPAVAAAHFEARSGYANYYFNLLNQKRVWQSFQSLGDFRGKNPRWEGRGKATGGGDFSFQLTDNSGELVLPTFQTKAALGDELADVTDPPQSGGLLVALHLWRRLLTHGLDNFGEVYYLGTAPLPDREGLFDVLVGIHGGVECHFYFDPANGHLDALEMFGGTDRDPCEIYFHDYRERQGRWLPGRLEVRSGGHKFGDYKLGELAFGRGGRP